MKITDILEIADKRTGAPWQVLMKRDEDGATGYYIRMHTHPAIAMDKNSYWDDGDEPSTDQDGYYQPDGYEDVMEYRIDNARYLSIAPEMEAKLREIVELIPQIEEYVNLAYKQSGNAGIQNGILALREKLKKWKEE